MATLYKKLVKKVKPKTKKTSEKPPEKIGKDYWLLAILLLTIFFTVMSWPAFDNINRALYSALIISLVSTYIRRQAHLTDEQETWAERISFLAVVCAIFLFIVKIYTKFIA